MFVAGEKLGTVESPKDYILVDGFGPTESFAFISSIRNSDKMHESSVGTLNYNTKAYVLDDELRRVPVGAVGELYLAGHQIADGYTHRRGIDDHNKSRHRHDQQDAPFTLFLHIEAAFRENHLLSRSILRIVW